MNWKIGLARISLVFWGGWSIVLIGIAVFTMFEDKNILNALPMLLTVVVFYVLHRVTCWIIEGFFSKRT